MKKIKKGIVGIILLVMVLCPNLVNAACSSEEKIQLQKDSLGVQISYEAGMFGTGEYEESEMVDEDGFPIEYEIVEPNVYISVYNITESVYVKVTNTSTGTEETYYYADTDNGTITWEKDDVSEIDDYEVRIYSNLANCRGDEVNKTSKRIPKYNPYSSYYYCQGVNESYCQEFVEQEVNITEEEMKANFDKLKGYTNSPTNEEEKNNNMKYILYVGVGILIVAGVAIVVMLIRKQRNKVI